MKQRKQRESKYENVVVYDEKEEHQVSNINELAKQLNVTIPAIYGAIMYGTRVKGWYVKAQLRKHKNIEFR